jgi:hypothetical protein
VHITGHELTVASSAVAGLAIVGGYLGVSSANRNALKIAREERSSQRKDELDALKRTTYAKALGALTTLAAANLEQAALLAGTNMSAAFQLAATRKRIDAMRAAHDSIAELELVSTNRQLRELANEALNGAMKCTLQDRSAFIRGAAKLRASLVDDLRGTEISGPEELDRMVDVAMARLSSGPDPVKGTT